MMNVTLRLLALAGAAAGSLALSAQTTTHHRTTATHTHHAVAAHPRTLCVAVPMLSPKIPALPEGSPCPKALFTISERLDYISPMIGPEVRENFSNLPMIFTLAYVDSKVGTGPLAQPHMWYTVQYTGYLTDGTKFDSSLDHPGAKPISFPYGAHRVIPGWDMGFEGMHVGGKRRLFIPYQLAYGAGPHGPSIPPKSELVFDMELISQSPTDPNPVPTSPFGPGRPGFPVPQGVPGHTGPVPVRPLTGAPGASGAAGGTGSAQPGASPAPSKPAPPAGAAPASPAGSPPAPKPQ